MLVLNIFSHLLVGNASIFTLGMHSCPSGEKLLHVAGILTRGWGRCAF